MWQGIDQRRFPRAKCKCVVTLREAGGSSTVSVNTENIGMGGVCVLLAKGLDIFSAVELDLALEDGKSPLHAKGTVVWVVQRKEFRKSPNFDTGVEFADLSAEDKARIEAVIDKANPAKKA